MAEPVQGISAVPDEGNARYFQVVVAGPKDVRQLLAHVHCMIHKIVCLYTSNPCV